MSKILQTLSIIEKGDQILLAMKKRGFGEGWWNSLGGKVEVGETIEDAAIREVLQESGIVVKRQKERGVIEFKTMGSDQIIEMHIFEVLDYEGKPVETEEMKPQWFNKDQLPFENMWPADKEWLPIFLQGKYFRGEVIFDSEIKKFIKADLQVVNNKMSHEFDQEFRREGEL